MSEKESSAQQQSGSWFDRILSGSLLDQNSTLELLIKVIAVIVVVTWIEGHYLSWKKSADEQAKLTNLGCVVPAALMVDLIIPRPTNGSSDVAGYILKRDEFSARVLADRAELKKLCWK